MGENDKEIMEGLECEEEEINDCKRNFLGNK